MKRTAPKLLAAPRADLPTPLAQVLAELDRETQPFRAVHRLVDAVEVLIKLHTVLLVSRFVEALESEAPGHGVALRKLLAGGLRTPSLGIWWAFAREAATALKAAGAAEPVAGLYAAVAPSSPLFTALEGPQNLIAFRNSYAHGATPDDATCLSDLATMRPRLDALCNAAWPLAQAELLAVQADGQALVLRGVGAEQVRVQVQGAAQAGRCYLRRADGTLLNLHPLLAWASAPGKGEGAFFYNDLRDKHASVLHYAWAHHARSAELRDDLLARYPISRWKEEASPDELQVRERVAALTDDFKGRRAELQALVADLGQREQGFTVLWGPPGMGKSALMARALDYLSWSPDSQRAAYPEFTPPMQAAVPLKLHVVGCFVRRSQLVDVKEIFEGLNRQLDRRFVTGVGGASNSIEAAQKLAQRLGLIGPALPAHERLVLVIDGLDEAAEFPEFVRGLPKLAPQRVHVLYASRPQPVLRADVYEQIDIRQRSERTLGGLSMADTRALLYGHADKYALERDSAWVQAVAARSEGNPLFLRLLCDALERGEVQINRLDSVPKGMGELYDGVMRRVAGMPQATELLALLAVSKAYMPTAQLHHLLGRQTPGLGLPAVIAAVDACAEVLIDNPATAEADWQLFHESLREYLHDRYAPLVHGWQARLAEVGLEWQALAKLQMKPREQRVTEAYALRWTPVHLQEVADHATHCGNTNEAGAQGDKLLGLVEDEAWRERCFLLAGNEALRRGVQLAQKVAVQRYRASDHSGDGLRVARLAQWTWGEELRLYEQQRQQLKCAHVGQGTHWRDVTDLAAMGARPKDRLVLAALALWGQGGSRSTQPDTIDLDWPRLHAWRDEADDSATTRLLWKSLGLDSVDPAQTQTR